MAWTLWGSPRGSSKCSLSAGVHVLSQASVRSRESAPTFIGPSERLAIVVSFRGPEVRGSRMKGGKMRLSARSQALTLALLWGGAIRASESPTWPPQTTALTF